MLKLYSKFFAILKKCTHFYNVVKGLACKTLVYYFEIDVIKILY